MEDAKEIGSNIKTWRKLKGLTQEELAQKTGLSTMSIRRYETGARIVPVDTITAIANALGISAMNLLPKDSLIQLSIDPSGMKVEYAGSWGKYELDTAKERISAAFDKLNPAGRQEALKRILELTEISRYCASKDTEDK